MNSAAAKAMLKMVKTFITPDQIKSAAAELLKMAVDYKKAIPLNSEAGEVEAAAIFYEVDDKGYFSIAIFDADNKVVRFEKTEPIESLIQSVIEKL